MDARALLMVAVWSSAALTPLVLTSPVNQDFHTAKYERANQDIPDHFVPKPDGTEADLINENIIPHENSLFDYKSLFTESTGVVNEPNQNEEQVIILPQNLEANAHDDKPLTNETEVSPFTEVEKLKSNTTDEQNIKRVISNNTIIATNHTELKKHCHKQNNIFDEMMEMIYDSNKADEEAISENENQMDTGFLTKFLIIFPPFKILAKRDTISTNSTESIQNGDVARNISERDTVIPSVVALEEYHEPSDEEEERINSTGDKALSNDMTAEPTLAMTGNDTAEADENHLLGEESEMIPIEIITEISTDHIMQ